ncbi:MAG: hypothetical protein WAQ27_05760 [Candidatus Microsaccharimonas sp.]
MSEKKSEPIVPVNAQEIRDLGESLQQSRVETARVEATRDLDRLEALKRIYEQTKADFDAHYESIEKKALAGEYSGYIEPEEVRAILAAEPARESAAPTERSTAPVADREIIDKTRKSDSLSEAAFASTAVDERKHRRVSVAHPTVVGASEVFTVPEASKDVDDAATAEKPTEAPAAAVDTKAEPKSSAKKAWDVIEEDLSRIFQKGKLNPDGAAPGTRALPWLDPEAKPATIIPVTSPDSEPAIAPVTEIGVKFDDSEPTDADEATEANAPIPIRKAKGGDAEPTKADDEPATEPEAAATPDPDAKPEKAAPRQAQGYYEGKRVQVYNALKKPDSEAYTLEVIDDEGKTYSIEENQLEITRIPGKEVELYRPEGRELVLVEAEITKSWWGRAREKYGLLKWSVKWTEALRGAAETVYGKALNAGIKEGMTDEEKQAKREKNRRNITFATGALVGAGLVGAGVLIANGIADHVNAAEAATNAPKGIGPNNLTIDQVRDLMEGRGGSGSGDLSPEALAAAEAAARAAEAANAAPATAAAYEAFSNPSYNITPGLGGEALFQKLNIDPQKFYDNQDYLLKNFGDYFYQEPGQAVRISNDGWLPPEAQRYIESLR